MQGEQMGKEKILTKDAMRTFLEQKNEGMGTVEIILIIVVLIFVVNNIKICSINPHEADYVYELIQDI